MDTLSFFRVEDANQESGARGGDNSTKGPNVESTRGGDNSTGYNTGYNTPDEADEAIANVQSYEKYMESLQDYGVPPRYKISVYYLPFTSQE